MLLARIRLGFGILLFLAVGLFLHYSLPSRDIVRIVGTDVARTDVEGRDAQGNTITVSRDVRFINAKWPDGRDRVYRNEDTGWGWPPYFKFDTADLAAEATDLVSAAGNPRWVVVRHYGWRIPMLSMFPNALSIRPATGPDERLTPWFNILFITSLALFLLILRRVAVILFRRHVDPVIEQIDQEIDEQSGALMRRYRRARRWLSHNLGI